MEVQANWLALLLSVVASMVVASIWYSKLFLGKLWQRQWKLSEADLKKGTLLSLGSAVVFGFFTAFVLAHVIYIARAFYGYGNLQTGIVTGFWMWLGFALPILGVNYLFARRSIILLGIDATNQLVTLLIMGAIIGAML